MTITTSLEGLPLTRQIQEIVSLEQKAAEQELTTVYLASDIEEQYRNTIFRKLSIVDEIPAGVIGYSKTGLHISDYTEESKYLFVLSPESIKESDDPVTTAICVKDSISLPVSFYQDAIDFIGEGAFIFISDDIEWCKEHFTGENIFYSPLTNEVEQLSLIARCSNVITGDDMKGVLGAWMGQTVFSKIVVPTDTFIDNLPSSWHRI